MRNTRNARKQADQQATTDAQAPATTDAPVQAGTDQQATIDAQHAAIADWLAPVPTGKRQATKSAKAWLRELLSADGAEYTIAQLVAATGKTEVNIRTMLSDLRSAKYAGNGGVFNTKSVRKNGVTYYSKA